MSKYFRTRLLTRAAARLFVFPAALLLASDSTYQWNLPKGFPTPHVPASNPMTVEKVELGRFLFYDKRLSVNGTMSCATCHKQELAFTDGRAFAIGATGQAHPRSALSLVNAGYSSFLTWSNPDLRTLEEQALIPMYSSDPIELGLAGKDNAILAAFRLDPVYRELFPRVFRNQANPFTTGNAVKAIAAFERTIISGRSPYDRYVHDGDQQAISESAKRGELLFFNEGTAGCFRCHNGFNFSDAAGTADRAGALSSFHNTALYNLAGLFSYPKLNLGAYEHTRKMADVGKFRTPSLRNVALTAPYMHDGSIATLEEVLDHYEAGGRTLLYGEERSQGSANPNKDTRMKGFRLTAQNRLDLIAFLETLTDVELIHDQRFSDPWPGVIQKGKRPN